MFDFFFTDELDEHLAHQAADMVDGLSEGGERRMRVLRHGDIVKSGHGNISSDDQTTGLDGAHRTECHQIIAAHDGRRSLGQVEQLIGEVEAALLGQVALQQPFLL